MKRIALALATSLFAALLVELFCFASGRILQWRGLIYRFPERPAHHLVASYQAYLEMRDPLLGWPFPSERGGELFDATGARRNPSFPDTARHPACVTLFGDSFMQGARVDHAHAWSNVLSRDLGCRVANFGQGGYGTDQAYLRFTRHREHVGKVVALGHMSENILRNVTRCRDLYTSSMDFALKPRFVVDAAGQLRVLPLPRLSESQYLRLVGLEDPPLALAHEGFALGGASGLTPFRFPFSVSLARSLRDYRMRAALARRPPYDEFYDPAHPAGGLAITAEILRSFVREAAARGVRPLVILFANRLDLDFHQATGTWTYGPLAERLAQEKLPVLDLGPLLEARLAGRESADVFEVTGHYNEEGNRIVAAEVASYLRENELLSAALTYTQGGNAVTRGVRAHDGQSSRSNGGR